LRDDSLHRPHLVASAAALLSALWISASVPTAHAQTRSPLPSLEVRRAPEASSCPDAYSVAAAVQRLLGRQAVDPDARSTPTRIVVDIAKSEHGLCASVHLTGARRGVRELRDDTDPTCHGLADALALTIALTLDALEPPGDSASVPKPRSTAKPTPAAPNSDAAWHASVEVGAGATLGLVGQPSPALFLDVGAVSPGASTLSLGYLAPWPQHNEFGRGTVRIQLHAVTMRACVPVLRSEPTVRLMLCAVPEAGVVRAAAAGYDNVWTSSRPWYALGAEGALVGALAGPLQWSIRASTHILLRDESFSVENLGVAYEPQRLAASLLGGFRVSIP
jgi:hypothetical protein